MNISEFERGKPVVTMHKINDLIKRIEDEKYKTEKLYKDRVESLNTIHELLTSVKESFKRGEQILFSCSGRLSLCMNYQQAIFIKQLVKDKNPLHKVAELFVNRFGPTEEIPVKGSRHKFSNLDGNDLKTSAESVLKERF